LSVTAAASRAGKTHGQLDAEEREWADQLPTLTRCGYDGCDWTFDGTARDGRREYANHREQAHGAEVERAKSESHSETNGGAPRRWTRDRIIAALQAEATDGAAPTSDSWTRRDPTGRRPAASTVIKTFGSWNAAVAAAGLEPRRRGGQAGTPTGRLHWTDDEMLDALRAYGREHGRAPTSIEWKTAEDSHPSAHTIGKRFGSWANAVERAGFARPTQGRTVADGQAVPIVWTVKVPGTGLRYRTVDEALIAADEIEHDGERVSENARRSGDDVKADKAVDQARELAQRIRDVANGTSTEAEAVVPPVRAAEPDGALASVSLVDRLPELEAELADINRRRDALIAIVDGVRVLAGFEARP
jgi:hypothetical protein